MVVLSFFASFALSFSSASAQQPSRYVIDDDEFVDKITDASGKLLHLKQLTSLKGLRDQLHTRGFALTPAPMAQQRLAPPDLYDRLRQSTLAIGVYYKCPDCGEWHFNSAAGFVVGSEGIICTCCHVLLAEDDAEKAGYMVAADADGKVFPVLSVLAADTEADTCFLKIGAHGLKPLPLRTGIRPGEHIFCLSHPGGYHFMFSEGMVARLNRRRNDMLDDNGQTNGLLTRPILFLNVTTEFAPGSSGGPIVDEAGNVVAQVASITDAGEPQTDDENAPISPSVPVRFCTASEEILRLTEPGLKDSIVKNSKPKPPPERKSGNAKGQIPKKQ